MHGERVHLETIKIALDKLRQVAGLESRLTPENDMEAESRVHRVEILGGVEDRTLEILFRSGINRASAGLIIREMADLSGKGLLVAGYVNPKLCDFFLERNVQFIDLAGNTYLNISGLFIFIKGNRPERKITAPTPGRAFRVAGLKIIHAMLCVKNLEKANLRVIAGTSGVSLGAVGTVIKDLKRLGFIEENSKTVRLLVNKEKLLSRWVSGYAELLRPKLVIGRFSAEDQDLWKFVEVKKGRSLWGGEMAANKMTRYRKSKRSIVYIEEEPEIFLKRKIFKINYDGNLELIKIFWKFKNKWELMNVVNPILIYADLIISGEDDDLEKANIIYNKEIIKIF